MLEDITNFMEVEPWLGTAGQPTREQFVEIRDAGFQVVINLATGTMSNAIPDEAELVNSLGMEYIWIPVVWTSPQPADLQAFFAAMERVRGRKVFAHCVLNMRVSSFVFLYRVLRLGMPVETASVDLWTIWEPDEVWQPFIDLHLASAASG